MRRGTASGALENGQTFFRPVRGVCGDGEEVAASWSPKPNRTAHVGRQEDAAVNGDYSNVIAATSAAIAEAVLTGETELKLRAQTVDVDVKELLRQVGLNVMTVIFNTLSKEVTRKAEAAGLVVNRRPSINYQVVFGQVCVESPYLWDAESRRSARPVCDELGLKGRARSPGVERALSDFGAEESFGQASKRFEEHYGWEVGRTSILRLVEDVASDAEEYVENRLAQARPDFDEPLGIRPGCEQMLVGLDGSEIRTGTLHLLPGRIRTPVRRHRRRQRKEEWRDVRVGLARALGSTEKTFVARIAPYAEVTELLFRAAVERGLSSGTQVVAPADGGNGLREALEEKFPGMKFILDRPHLKGHLFETADALGYTGSKRQAWVDKHMNDIDAGRVLSVIKRLKTHHRRAANERLRQLIGYITKFKDAVHYEHYRQLGLPCGSGEARAHIVPFPRRG